MESLCRLPHSSPNGDDGGTAAYRGTQGVSAALHLVLERGHLLLEFLPLPRPALDALDVDQFLEKPVGPGPSPRILCGDQHKQN